MHPGLLLASIFLFALQAPGQTVPQARLPIVRPAQALPPSKVVVVDLAKGSHPVAKAPATLRGALQPLVAPAAPRQALNPAIIGNSLGANGIRLLNQLGLAARFTPQRLELPQGDVYLSGKLTQVAPTWTVFHKDPGDFQYFLMIDTRLWAAGSYVFDYHFRNLAAPTGMVCYVTDMALEQMEIPLQFGADGDLHVLVAVEHPGSDWNGTGTMKMYCSAPLDSDGSIMWLGLDIWRR